MKEESWSTYLFLPVLLVGFVAYRTWSSLNFSNRVLTAGLVVSLGLLVASFLVKTSSRWGRERLKRLEEIESIPSMLLSKGESILMGEDVELNESVFLPDIIRKRHVHVIGATGSGKTESVVLNFLAQDISRGLGAIILDAKGDASFLRELATVVPGERLRVFDLSDPKSVPYNPLAAGSALESAQRLFASLTWSEEYYRSKALSALQRLFQTHFESRGCNPSLRELAGYLESPKRYSAFVLSDDFPVALALEDYKDLSGLRDQIRSLTIGHLGDILSPKSEFGVCLEEAKVGAVVYFRLQSLMSPELVKIVGKLTINHLSYLAGTAHRSDSSSRSQLIPVYLDEFATFACPEFADLISKARSANFALHFSHQSVGDLTEVSPGFLSRITDNSATKIVMRINDPESAEYFARTFGTREFQKSTQRVTNAKDMDQAEVVGEGTIRDARQFRASPDLLKTLPTGMGAVLVAHGVESSKGASSVFKIRFPPLNLATHQLIRFSK